MSGLEMSVAVAFGETQGGADLGQSAKPWAKLSQKYWKRAGVGVCDLQFPVVRKSGESLARRAEIKTLPMLARERFLQREGLRTRAPKNPVGVQWDEHQE